MHEALVFLGRSERVWPERVWSRLETVVGIFLLAVIVLKIRGIV